MFMLDLENKYMVDIESCWFFFFFLLLDKEVTNDARNWGGKARMNPRHLIKFTSISMNACFCFILVLSICVCMYVCSYG